MSPIFKSGQPSSLCGVSRSTTFVCVGPLARVSDTRGGGVLWLIGDLALVTSMSTIAFGTVGLISVTPPPLSSRTCFGSVFSHSC